MDRSIGNLHETGRRMSWNVVNRRIYLQVMACVLSVVDQEQSSPTPSSPAVAAAAEQQHDLRTAMPASRLPQYLKEVTQLTADLRLTCHTLSGSNLFLK
jgi:hypothetical protein